MPISIAALLATPSVAQLPVSENSPPISISSPLGAVESLSHPAPANARTRSVVSLAARLSLSGSIDQCCNKLTTERRNVLDNPAPHEISFAKGGLFHPGSSRIDEIILYA